MNTQPEPDLSASIPTGNTITVPADQVPSGPTPSHPEWERNDQELPPELEDITVIARSPSQMERAQTSLIEWAKRKIASVEAEAADLKENVEIAKKSKWGSSALHRAWQRSVATLEYYQKILAALEAGFCIVPNFPVDLIAIRTKRKNPEKGETSNSPFYDQHQQIPQKLPIGEGEYKNPLPIVHQISTGKDEQGREMKIYFAKYFRDNIEFPFTTAKPEILSATAKAMADKVFDEIGVLPGKKKKEDPIIVGRIIHPKDTKYSRQFVTFLIAWFVDTRVL